ncbi:hypothetical protein FM113_11375 [Leucobacter sp. 7(1)]|nr:hypothetical protein FM113_11375 [Leucobacter sp. 7(1)]
MMHHTESHSAWQRFWERGGWWRALLLVAVYYGLYQGLAVLVVSPLAAANRDNPDANIWLSYALPIALGGVILVVFGLSVRWLRELFGPQPVHGRWWMWIGVAIPLIFAVLHFAAIDYGAAGTNLVLGWLVSGLFIGFAEEVLARGFVVQLLRRAGYREIAVATISAALFSALHAGNLLGGQDLLTTLIQLVYTFAFGILMYLTLRVTGNLIWPILLHAATDPSTALLAEFPGGGGLAAFAGLGNFFVIGAGLILLFCIRGHSEWKPRAGEPHPE